MKKLLEELFARYYRDVYRYLYSLSHDPSLAEDLTSEVFLEVVRSIALFRGESDIRTWIFSIARHRWFRYLRKTGERTAQMLPQDVPAAELPLELRFQDRETAERIRQLLRAEPERIQTVVGMRVEGYSFREIGKRVGISEQSARVIWFRAKTKIQKLLMEEGFVDA